MKGCACARAADRYLGQELRSHDGQEAGIGHGGRSAAAAAGGEQLGPLSDDVLDGLEEACDLLPELPPVAECVLRATRTVGR